MKKTLMVSALAAVAATMIVGFRPPHWVHVTVESVRHHRNFHRIDNFEVKKLRSISKEPCDEGKGWGVSRKGIWVDKGCKAEFAVRVP